MTHLVKNRERVSQSVSQ